MWIRDIPREDLEERDGDGDVGVQWDFFFRMGYFLSHTREAKLVCVTAKKVMHRLGLGVRNLNQLFARCVGIVTLVACLHVSFNAV